MVPLRSATARCSGTGVTVGRGHQGEGTWHLLSWALKIAHRRRMIGENVATLVDPPSIDETEAKAFLEAAAKRPTFMRWIVGVGMGFRQGETLGLRRPYVDFEVELFHPKWQLRRLTWRHGCGDAHTCGARLPEAVHQDLRQAREHLPRPQGRWTGLHPPEDQEEPDPMAALSIPAPTGSSSRNCSKRRASRTVACTAGAVTPPARS